MQSSAGKAYDKTKIVKPFSKQKRMNIYASHEMTSSKPRKSEPKFSPFTTVSRTARDSYLLRVTNEPNTQTNYEPSFGQTLRLDRRATIDKSAFNRTIGDVRDPYKFEKPINEDIPKRCIKSISDFSTIDNPSMVKPLTSRDCQRWRKTYQHYDFEKMPISKTEKEYKKMVDSTSASFFDKETMRKTMESNFNNYRRFSLRVSPEKAHDFNSDSPHKYLEKSQIPKNPEYDLTNSNESFLRKAMSRTKG